MQNITTNEQIRSFSYLGLILLLIAFLGIEKGLTLSVLLVVAITGLTWTPLYEKATPAIQKIMDECKELCTVLLVVWCVRSFVLQPFRVPTGSLEPTIKPGDFLLVKQWAYGLRIPVLHTPIIGKKWLPHRGDIALFYWPVNPSIIFVKRVIGLPGDTISYKNKTLSINGKVVSQIHPRSITHIDEYGYNQRFVQATEQLGRTPHAVYLNPQQPSAPARTWTVPAHHYFMMGDNRDNSGDSRYWGFVSEKALIGQAKWIWMSWNPTAWVKKNYAHLIRWQRIGQSLL